MMSTVELGPKCRLVDEWITAVVDGKVAIYQALSHLPRYNSVG